MSFWNFFLFLKCYVKLRDGLGVWEGNVFCVIVFLWLLIVIFIEKCVVDDN